MFDFESSKAEGSRNGKMYVRFKIFKFLNEISLNCNFSSILNSNRGLSVYILFKVPSSSSKCTTRKWVHMHVCPKHMSMADVMSSRLRRVAGGGGGGGGADAIYGAHSCINALIFFFVILINISQLGCMNVLLISVTSSVCELTGLPYNKIKLILSSYIYIHTLIL